MFAAVQGSKFLYCGRIRFLLTMPSGVNKITNSAGETSGFEPFSRYTQISKPLSNFTTVAGPSAASASAFVVVPVATMSFAACNDMPASRKAGSAAVLVLKGLAHALNPTTPAHASAMGRTRQFAITRPACIQIRSACHPANCARPAEAHRCGQSAPRSRNRPNRWAGQGHRWHWRTAG